MFNKKTSYEVNVQDITFWRKKINVDNTEVFVRECLNDPFMLYLDKVKGDNYLDWVTGRPFIMEDFGKDFLLSLSNIKISKENVTICDDAVGKALYILEDSYFCNIIFSKYGLDVIPANFVYDEIRRFRKIYVANNDKDNIRCKSLKKKRK